MDRPLGKSGGAFVHEARPRRALGTGGRSGSSIAILPNTCARVRVAEILARL